jgi:MFS family permease
VNDAEPRLPRVVKSLGWVSLFTDASSEMIYPLLPAFLKSIGAGSATLGMMEGIAESVSALVKWWAGGASDSRARKPFVLVGYGIATLARPLLALATAPWHVIAIRTTDRIGKGIRAAPRDAIVAHAVLPRARGRAFGFHRMMDNTGSVLGPIFAFVLARAFGWPLRWIFAAAIVPGLLAVATVIWGVREERRAEEAAPALPATSIAPPDATAARALPPMLKRYLLVVALFTLGASADSFLMLRLTDLGLAPSWIPVAWVTLSATKALTNMPGGRSSDRFGRKRTQITGWLVYAAAYAVFPLTESVAITWALIALYGAYYGLTEGGEKAIVADLIPADLRGRGYGALNAVTGFAILPANALFGVLYTDHAAWAFGLSAIFALAAALALAFTVRLRPEASSPDGTSA